MNNIFVITIIGVGIDTEVHLFNALDEADRAATDFLKEFEIEEPTVMCEGCWKGYSNRAQCDVEIQIHDCLLPV